MSRLFITEKEIDFIADLNKELIKDLIGQKIYFYPISVEKSNIHEIYGEAINKIFETPIAVDAIINYLPEEISTNEFSSEEYSSIEAFIQPRDLLDKGIEINEGDFFSFGEKFFEIVSAVTQNIIFGQVEHDSTLKLVGKQSRKSNFIAKINGPTDERFSDAGAVQDTFHQQRGDKMNKEGLTGDKRELREAEILEPPIEGPSEVSPRGTNLDGKVKSSFYSDE